ncbi:Fic family protein [Lyngbya sp. CCAP 1446/10]|uniref:Fic family protein n=1 Tax=Lyngbya sp. CCAP 1446/10 TaxID=439293 RepID=UPI002238EA59|nr:Fic family protein [Lyngbya sp. CCAP 1446/10]
MSNSDMLLISLPLVSVEQASCLFCRNKFIAVLVRLYPQRLGDILHQHFPFSSAMNLSEKLQKVDRLKVWLDSFRPLSPTLVSELKKLYDVRFTYHSNAIEGNTLTQRETELVLKTGITVGGKTLREHLEVIGHRDAIDYIEALTRSDTAIGEWEIKQIHNLIIRAIAPDEAGRYRQLDVKAAGTEYLYPPHYLLSDLMPEFIQWLNSDQIKSLHPLEFAAEAHLRFVSIHPFRDGNGRTGRLLMNLLLLRAGYPIVIVSNQVRAAYIEAIAQAQQNDSGIHPLLDLIVDAARYSLIETLQIVATASDSQSQGLPFYQEMLTVLQQQSQELD